MWSNNNYVITKHATKAGWHVSHEIWDRRVDRLFMLGTCHRVENVGNVG